MKLIIKKRKGGGRIEGRVLLTYIIKLFDSTDTRDTIELLFFLCGGL